MKGRNEGGGRGGERLIGWDGEKPLFFGKSCVRWKCMAQTDSMSVYPARVYSSGMGGYDDAWSSQPRMLRTRNSGYLLCEKKKMF